MITNTVDQGLIKLINTVEENITEYPFSLQILWNTKMLM